MSDDGKNFCPPAAVLFRRGSIVESQHRAYACVVGSDGEVRYSLGDPDYVTFMRSSAKPLQALLTITTGAAERFGLTDRELAVISGSHGGEEMHVKAVTTILARAGLDQKALRCGVHPPLDADARKALRKDNTDPTPLHHNCSGKHAGMLLCASQLGCSMEDYLDPSHDVQLGIVEIIAMMAGIAKNSVQIGIDGCSAPVHGISMRSASLTFARLVDPPDLTDDLTSACNRIAEAMRAYPEMVAADQNRICTELMRAGASSHLIAKAGAEGYYAAAWKDSATGRGVGMVVKVEDGSQRARDPLVVSILQHLAVLHTELPESLQQFSAGSIKNHMKISVGEIEVVL